MKYPRLLLPDFYGLLLGLYSSLGIQEASEVYFDTGEKQRGCTLVKEALGIFRNYMQTAELPKPNVEENLNPMLAALKIC